MAIYLVALLLALQDSGRESIQYNIGHVQVGAYKVTIKNDNIDITFAMTGYTDLGPNVGSILNAHYFPGVTYYQGGQYQHSYNEFTYVLNRPTYLDGNPNQIYYLTTAYYMRGMIFLYHAEGAGRLTLARKDFESAIKLNAQNYPAHLQLAHVFLAAGQKEKAASVLQKLIDLKPDPEILEQAKKELAALPRTQNH